jgi:hypothetical protein
MRAKLGTVATLMWIAAALAFSAGGELKASGAESKLQTQLVWGTDDAKAPEGKDYKPVEPAIGKKLKELPLKWKNYFEVKRIDFSVAPAVLKKVPLSEKCGINVLSQGNESFEFSLIGKGKEVVKRTQALGKGEVLVLGGNAPNSTAWLVIVKRVE